jgi:hypothetical protein
MIVGPIQPGFAQYALNNFYSAAGIASGLTARAVQRRPGMIRSIGVGPLLYSASCQSQNLTPRGRLDSFEIHAIRGAATQQRIQINGDVVGQLLGDRLFF